MFDIFAGKDPQRALKRAYELIKEGKSAQAIKVLEDNLTEGEESFELYLELARLYYETEQRDSAVEILRTCQSIVPSRTDEIIALLSDFFYRHPTIDAGDFLLQLFTAQEQYEEIFKVLRAFNDREVRLLINKYDKLKQAIAGKKVLTKKDIENIIITTTIDFIFREPKSAIESIAQIIEVEEFQKMILNWAKVLSRERFNDPYAGFLLLKLQLATGNFEEAINQAHRCYEKFPDFLDLLVDILSPIQPPKEFESDFSELLTELYVKKGDLESSLARLKAILQKDPKRVDEVIKTFRELQRINPKSLKVLYALGDTLLAHGRVSLAISELEKIMEIDPTQTEQVENRYKQAFEKEQNNPLVIQGLVNFYLRQNRFDNAVSIIERAYNFDRGLIDEYVLNLTPILEKNPDNLKGLYLLGLCYAHKGEDENAIVIIEELMARNNFEMVEKMLKEILRIKPDDFNYLNLAARNLINLKRVEEAFSILNPHLGEELSKTITFVPTLDAIINLKPEFSTEVINFYLKHQNEEPEIFNIALARAYAFIGDYEKSVNNFDECIANDDLKDTAKRALIEVIRDRPKAVPLLLSAARIFMKEGEVEIATQFFKTAQSIDPNAFFKIIDEFYDTLKAFPKDRETRILLIDTFFNRKLYDRVIEEAKKGIEVFGNEAQYFNLRLGQALIEKGSLTDGVRPLMLALDGEKDYSKDVLEYLNKILTIDKSNVPAHFARGRALARSKQIDEAVEEYLLTARIVPARAEYVLEELKNLSSRAVANPKVLYAMGSIEVMLKRYDDGTKHLLQSCELDNSLVKRTLPIFEKLIIEKPTPFLEFLLARLYYLANLKNSAIKYYIAAQEHDKKFLEPAISEMKKICAELPQDIESRKGLAQIYFNYNNLEDALSLTEEIYQLNPDEDVWIKSFISNILTKNSTHIPSYYFLSFLFLQEKDYSKALDVFKKLLEIAPGEVPEVIKRLSEYKENDPGVMYYLGVLYKNIGDFKNTLDLFENLFGRDKNYADLIIGELKEILIKNAQLGEAYLLLGKIFTYQKNYDATLNAYSNVGKLIPQKWEELALKKGQIYFEKGEIEKAMEIYNGLLEETKDRKAVYKIIKKTKDEYLKENLEKIKGESEEERLMRANIHLQLNRVTDAEKELNFVPQDEKIKKNFLILTAQICLRKKAPIDALEIMRSLPVDEDTALLFADIYEAIGSYEAAAAVLRQIGGDRMKKGIEKYEKLAQEKRLFKGRYFIEGRL